MPVDSKPHSSWADVYDLVYEHSFRNFYRELTEVTLTVIEDRVKPSSRIVDFGAGTGRLSIPLSKKGFNVIAVDPCEEMLAQLKQKQQNGNIQTICSKMEGFTTDDKFDVALCVFTVLLYLLDKESLLKALSAACQSLKPGGILLIDIPSEGIFHGYSYNEDALKRSVSITEQGENIYKYSELIKIESGDGEEQRYQDEFTIRYWPKETVLEKLYEVGFSLEEDLSEVFSGAGSSYYIMKKTNKGMQWDCKKTTEK